MRRSFSILFSVQTHPVLLWRWSQAQVIQIALEPFLLSLQLHLALATVKHVLIGSLGIVGTKRKVHHLSLLEGDSYTRDERTAAALSEA